MLQEFAKKLIDSIPDNKKKKEKIDIILDGGVFNGSYLAGALFFVKEMERVGFYEVDRISCYSIGVLVSLLFHIDKLDMVLDIYQYSIQHIGKKQNIDILNDLIEKIALFFPENIHETVSNKIFISYHNIEKNRKITKSKYKSKEELLDTIRRSCFFPLFLNGDLFYKKKYVDGMSPYIFSKSKGKRIIYIQLLSYDKLIDSFCIQKEKTNIARICHGLLDIHSFYLNKKSEFCKYIDCYSISFWIFTYLKFLCEKILIFILWICFVMGDSWYKKLQIYKIIKSFFSNFFKEYYSDFYDVESIYKYNEFNPYTV